MTHEENCARVYSISSHGHDNIDEWAPSTVSSAFPEDRGNDVVQATYAIARPLREMTRDTPAFRHSIRKDQENSARSQAEISQRHSPSLVGSFPSICKELAVHQLTNGWIVDEVDRNFRMIYMVSTFH